MFVCKNCIPSEISRSARTLKPPWRSWSTRWRAIPPCGRSGTSGGRRPWPEPGQGDIDLFIYAERIPAPAERLARLQALDGLVEQVEVGRLAGGHWGQADALRLAGVETWLMYFTPAEALAELEATLQGRYPGQIDEGYYPVGRLAMWQTMRAWYDPDGFLAGLQRRLDVYPELLAGTLFNYHLEACLDSEDLERAAQRSDLLFYHFALDQALDHFLQALFALNRVYFPSRKRSEAYLPGFKLKPVDCAARLHATIGLGANPETLSESYRAWAGLAADLALLVEGERLKRQGS